MGGFGVHVEIVGEKQAFISYKPGKQSPLCAQSPRPPEQLKCMSK